MYLDIHRARDTSDTKWMEGGGFTNFSKKIKWKIINYQMKDLKNEMKYNQLT